jgi:hypothetical protein
MGIVTIIDITECNYQSNLIPLHLHTVRAINVQGNANKTAMTRHAVNDG